MPRTVSELERSIEAVGGAVQRWLAAHAAVGEPAATAHRRLVAAAAAQSPAVHTSITQDIQNFATEWEPVVGILFFVAIIFILWRTLKVMPRIKPQQIRPSSRQSVSFSDIAGVEDAKARAAGDRRVPARPQALRAARRLGAQGDPPARAAGHRQDAAGQGGRLRVRCAVLRAVGGVVRRDVRRPGRRADQAAVRDRAQERTGDHLHRRARRRGRSSRQRHLRREGPDAQPAARRDGRLRVQRARRGHRGVEPAREARPGAAAPRAL